MKKILLILIISSLLLNGCQKQANPNGHFKTIDNTLDIMTMAEYEDKLYLATNEGLYVMDSNNQISLVKLIKPLSIIHTLFVSSNKDLYVGGMNGLIIIKSNKTQTYFDDRENWLPDTRILCVYEDNNNNKDTIYIGTFSGLGILNPKTMSGNIMTEKDGLLSNNVNVITRTDDGSLWLASYNVRGGGITKIKDSKIKYYKDELATINITSLLKEKKQTLFCRWYVQLWRDDRI